MRVGNVFDKRGEVAGADFVSLVKIDKRQSVLHIDGANTTGGLKQSHDIPWRECVIGYTASAWEA